MNSFKRVLSTVLAMAATVTVGYLTISGELDLAAKLAGVIVVLLVLLAYLFGLFAQPPEPKNLCDIARQLGDQIDGLWGPEASNRRIYQHHFVPVQLYQSTKHRSALQHVSSRAWKATEYQDALVSLVHRKGVRRAVILGEPGLGKSTLALMLLLGLRATDPDCLPLLLSVGSWDMDAERFHSWLDRQLAINYRAVNAMGDDRIKQLVYSDQVLIILDGLDGLGEANLARAIAQINETIPSDRPLVVLSRPPQARVLDALVDGDSRSIFCLRPPGTRAIQQYLRFVARTKRALAGWRIVADEIKTEHPCALSELLRSPLFLDMALRTYRSPSQIQAFVHSVRNKPVALAEATLIDAYLQDQFVEAANGPPHRSARWLEYIAHRVGEFDVDSIAWWRVADAVPDRVLVAAITLCLAPAYWLALLMPPGLTRGLAIGTFTGILIGVTRARSLHHAAMTGSLITLLLVGSIGAARTTSGVAVADAAQLSVSVGLIILLKTEMIVPEARYVRRLAERWAWLASRPTLAGFAARIERCGRPLAAITLTGLAPATATALLHDWRPGIAADRSFSGVWMAVSFGVAVAVLSARLLVPVASPPRPSRMTLRSRGTRLGSVMPHVSAGIASAVSIGLAGGIVGALRNGFAYGATLTVLFGLVAGLPIGIAGGIIRWLNEPTIQHVTASPIYTLRNDWCATFGCIAVVSVTSAGSIAALLGPLHFLTMELGYPLLVRPVHGLLFGATVGAIVACYYNATPGFLIGVCWFSITRKLPWRLMSYLRTMQAAGLLRQVGAVYEFRHKMLRERLAWRYHHPR